MTHEIKVVKTLDLRGMYCPGPVLETGKAIKTINVGEVLEVIATDPAAKSDLQAWARRAGHEIIDMKEENGVLRVLIKRTK